MIISILVKNMEICKLTDKFEVVLINLFHHLIYKPELFRAEKIRLIDKAF